MKLIIKEHENKYLIYNKGFVVGDLHYAMLFVNSPTILKALISLVDEEKHKDIISLIESTKGRSWKDILNEQ